MEMMEKVYKPIIGMVHLQPLPGSPGFCGNIEEIFKRADADAIALKEGGVDGIIVENAGDAPAQIGDGVDVSAIAVMSVAAKRMVELTQLPIGINCIANAVKADFAICKASGASFIRSTSWANGYFSSSGYVPPAAAEGMRYQRMIGAEYVRVFADVQVKNGSHFIVSDKSIVEQCNDIAGNGADYIIITGSTTGAEPNFEELKRIKKECRKPIILGSGATTDNIGKFLEYCDGVIVGTYFKETRKMSEPVILSKVKEFMAVVNKYRVLGA